MLSHAPTTDVTIFSNNTDEKDCLGSITMVTRDNINAATTTALLHTDWSWIPKGKFIERNIVQGNVLTTQRNAAVQNLKGDWLIFIDDDMVWQPDAVKRLIEAREEIDADILGGLCFKRAAPHQPTLLMRETPDAGMYNWLENWDSDIVEVDATGMAFVIIHKRVFEKIAGTKMPPLAIRRQIGTPNFFRWEGVLGEDLRFCQDAKKAGCRIFVDTRIEIGHMAEVEIRRRDFLLQLASRPREIEDERLRVNAKMGLPTVTREEARRMLDA